MEDKIESAGEEFKISRIVKSWKTDYSLQPTRKAPWSKKEGPFFELGKTEARALTKKIMSELSDLIDWNKPDLETFVQPKYVPELQVCKIGGK